MKRMALPLPTLVFCLGVMLPTAAQAVLMRVDFSVLADPSDPVNAGQTGTGYFIFDSGIIPSGGGDLDDATGLHASDLSFTWDGHTWTTADADVSGMSFDSGGDLIFWHIGGAPSGFNNVNHGIYPDFWLNTFFGFAYATDNSPSVGFPYVGGKLTSWSVAPIPVAEPGSLALLGPALLPLGIMLRRRMKS
jgi:hypothetical protein